jgi:hypothetical protein
MGSCTSSKPYAPSEVAITGGQAWSQTDAVPALDHKGPWVGLTVGWTLGPGRKTQEALWALDGQLERLTKVEREALQVAREQRELQLQEAISSGVVVNLPEPPPVVVEEPSAMDRIFDFGAGPLGIPYAVWAALVLIMLGVARKLGVPLPLIGKKKG